MYFRGESADEAIAGGDLADVAGRFAFFDCD